jgi:hypothetical protein
MKYKLSNPDYFFDILSLNGYDKKTFLKNLKISAPTQRKLQRGEIINGLIIKKIKHFFLIKNLPLSLIDEYFPRYIKKPANYEEKKAFSQMLEAKKISLQLSFLDLAKIIGCSKQHIYTIITQNSFFSDRLIAHIQSLLKEKSFEKYALEKQAASLKKKEQSLT